MYALIEIAGKQYKIEDGEVFEKAGQRGGGERGAGAKAVTLQLEMVSIGAALPYKAEAGKAKEHKRPPHPKPVQIRARSTA